VHPRSYRIVQEAVRIVYGSWSGVVPAIGRIIKLLVASPKTE
jgi:hypothetical protein